MAKNKMPDTYTDADGTTIAVLEFRAPDRLVKFLAKEGFCVSLSIIRAQAMMVDPGAYPMDPCDPFDDNDRASIEGIVSAYGATEGSLDENDQPTDDDATDPAP